MFNPRRLANGIRQGETLIELEAHAEVDYEFDISTDGMDRDDVLFEMSLFPFSTERDRKAEELIVFYHRDRTQERLEGIRVRM